MHGVTTDKVLAVLTHVTEGRGQQPVKQQTYCLFLLLVEDFRHTVISPRLDERLWTQKLGLHVYHTASDRKNTNQ